MFNIFTHKYLCLILFQTHPCDPLQILNNNYFVIVCINLYMVKTVHGHTNIWLQTVTYIATTRYLKKSYVYEET